MGQTPEGRAILWTRTLDRITKAELPEFVIRISGPPSEKTQHVDLTQTKDTYPLPGERFKHMTHRKSNSGRRRINHHPTTTDVNISALGK